MENKSPCLIYRLLDLLHENPFFECSRKRCASLLSRSFSGLTTKNMEENKGKRTCLKQFNLALPTNLISDISIFVLSIALQSNARSIIVNFCFKIK